MNKIYVRSLSLGMGIEAVVKTDSDRNAVIYINSDMDEESREKALNRIIKGINQTHYQKSAIIERN